MTQALFAGRFGFPLETLKNWEYGRRRPTGASLTLLNVIARNPRAVLTALRRPPEARPAEDYTALWDAEAARSAAMRAEGEDETSRMDACPQCGRPWPSFEETLDRGVKRLVEGTGPADTK